MVSASGFQINARAEAARETFARRSGGDAGRALRAGSRGPDGRGRLAFARSRTRREGVLVRIGGWVDRLAGGGPVRERRLEPLTAAAERRRLFLGDLGVDAPVRIVKPRH